MTYKVELSEEGDYVRIILLNQLTRTEHEDFRAKALSAIDETGWDKVLIDATSASPKMSFTDDYDFTRELQSHLPINLNTAIVHCAHEAERYQFIEDVAINRGVNLRTFTNESEALNWLLGV